MTTSQAWNAMTRRSRCQTREIPLDLRVVRRWQLSDVTEVVHGQRPDACGCPPGRRMRLRLRRRVMSLSSLSSDGDAKRRRTKSGRASRLCGGTIDVVSLGNAPGLVTNWMELDFQVDFDDDVMLPDEEESVDVICVGNIGKGLLWSCSRGRRATPSCRETGQKSLSRKG